MFRCCKPAPMLLISCFPYQLIGGHVAVVVVLSIIKLPTVWGTFQVYHLRAFVLLWISAVNMRVTLPRTCSRRKSSSCVTTPSSLRLRSRTSTAGVQDDEVGVYSKQEIHMSHQMCLSHITWQIKYFPGADRISMWER